MALLRNLQDRARHLSEIHAAPEFCWPGLVKQMVAGDWTVVQTQAAVKAVLAIRPPRGYEALYPV